MDDDVAEGSGGIGASPPLINSAVDKAARDEEFTLFYGSELASLVGFLVVQGARPVIAAELAQDAMTEAYRALGGDRQSAFLGTDGCVSRLVATIRTGPCGNSPRGTTRPRRVAFAGSV
jgi:hypothetical protein